MGDVYCVILAGGCGQRLWPLSSKKRPKQFIPFIKQKTLIELALERAFPLVRDKEHIIVVTNELYRDILAQTCANMVGHVIYEPIGRNTAPAILQACLYINGLNPDAMIVVLPADHFIPDVEKFCGVMKESIVFTREQCCICLLGVVPTVASTGYGYIQTTGKQRHQKFQIYDVEKFHEKPNKQTAGFYLTLGDMLWNCGIFIGKVAVFLTEYFSHAPMMYASLLDYIEGKTSYTDVPKLSIDVAVIEKSTKVVVALAEFEWYDVGNLETFVYVVEMYGGVQHKIISLDGENNISYTKKKIVMYVGVQNLCLVETNEALIVFDRQKKNGGSAMEGLLQQEFFSDLS